MNRAEGDKRRDAGGAKNSSSPLQRICPPRGLRTPRIVLIHPPVAKPGEPPAGIARLSGALSIYGVKHQLVDANIEGLLYLLLKGSSYQNRSDPWTKRAFRHRRDNLSLMQSLDIYGQSDRYQKVVKDIGKVLAEVSSPGTVVGLTHYGHEGLSPLRSSDLLTAAGQPERNPFYPYFIERIEEIFSRREPSAVGFSLNYLSQALCAFSMIGFIRRSFPEIKIIAGGGLITSWMRSPGWKNPFDGLIDHLVAGPGECRLLHLLGREPLQEMPPCPDYTRLPYTEYLSPGPVFPYSASSGCSWKRCAFCPEKAEDNPYLPLPLSQAVSDLKGITQKNNPALIHLLDNAISPALLDALAREPVGAPWYGFTRIDPRLADLDYCMRLKQAGCLMLKLGIESGDQAVLDALGKGISTETSSRALTTLKKAGIATYVYLLFGTPPETEMSARKTLSFIVRHSGSIDFLNLAIFNMPVSYSAGIGLQKRSFYDGDLSLYTDFVHPHGWDRRKVRKFLTHEFRKQPAVSSILKNEPPQFTSNHAPFFLLAQREKGNGGKKNTLP